jgi:hypothetical protein
MSDVALKIIERATWGAREPVAERKMLKAPVAVVFHQTTGDALARSAEDSAAWVRSIQNYHMDTRGYSDIAYSFLFDGHGNIFVGRGWDVVHAGNAPNEKQVGGLGRNPNQVTISAAYLGDSSQGFPPAAVAAASFILWAAIQRYGTGIRRYGHNDLKATACPGTGLKAWLSRGSVSPDLAVIPITIAGQPTVVPAVAPVPEESKPDKFLEEIVAALPTLKLGSEGRDVRRLQALLNINLPGDAQIDEDGKFGPNTDRVLKDFQKITGSVANGACGPAVWKKLLTI